MSSRMTKAFRFLLILIFAGTFIGCGNLSRRRPPKRESIPPIPPEPRPIKPRGASPGPDLRIPADPRPAPPEAPREIPSRPQARSTPPTGKIIRAGGTQPPADSQLPDSAEENLQRLLQLHQESVQEYSKIGSYIARLTRQEWSRGKLSAPEVVLFRHRKQPMSLYFKWLAGPHKGREVVYVEGQYEGKLHTKVAQGDVPFVRAGKVLSFSPDSALVRANSRHDIRDAGIGKLIDEFGAILKGMQHGNSKKGRAVYRGRRQHPDVSGPLECIELIIPAGSEETLPRGGRRWCYLSPRNHLPTLVITQDEKNRVVEYYRYDRIQYPVQLDENDFNPAVLWGKAAQGR